MSFVDKLMDNKYPVVLQGISFDHANAMLAETKTSCSSFCDSLRSCILIPSKNVDTDSRTFNLSEMCILYIIIIEGSLEV